MTGGAAHPGEGPFSLAWFATRESVKNRFSGLPPGREIENVIGYPLGSIAERIWMQGGFCPAVLLAGPERIDDEVIFDFQNDKLSAVCIRFGYAFDVLGHDPDTLSEQAMSSYASAEFHKLVLEFAVRYGAPSHLSERVNRVKGLHGQGMALFGPKDGSIVQIIFGHDAGAALVGEIRYKAFLPQSTGF